MSSRNNCGSGRDPDADDFLIWYLIGKGRLDEAKRMIEEIVKCSPDEQYLPRQKAMLDARLRNFSEAESRIQADTGFPNYTLLERDHYLGRIRQSPDFIQFIAEMKALNENIG